jgi:hypothetical protein
VTNKTVRGVKIKKIPLFGRVDKRCRPRPDIAALKKAQWEDPAYREKCLRPSAPRTRLIPRNTHALVSPQDTHARSVAPLWERAEELADRFIQIMKDQGELPDEVVEVVTGRRRRQETCPFPR